MKSLRTYSHSTSQSIVFCNLMNVYNTHVYEPYKQDLLPDNREMFGLFLTLEGDTTFVLKNGKKISALKNTILFVRVSELASIISKTNHRHCINYWFMAHGINPPINKVYHLNNIDLEKEVAFVSQIINLLDLHVDKKVQYANAKFTCKLLEWIEEIQTSEFDKSDVISEATLYINANIETEINVKNLAKQFGYCEKHIRSIFKTSLGLSPKKFIDSVRLEHSATLLVTTNLTLQEISDKLCFSSVSHFINSFKQKYGVTPTIYRQKTNNQMFYLSPSISITPPDKKSLKSPK